MYRIASRLASSFNSSASKKLVTVSLDDTIILHGGGDKKLIEERCEELRTTMEKSTAVFDKEKAQERLSKLSGGVAVFMRLMELVRQRLGKGKIG